MRAHLNNIGGRRGNYRREWEKAVSRRDAEREQGDSGRCGLGHRGGSDVVLGYWYVAGALVEDDPVAPRNVYQCHPPVQRREEGEGGFWEVWTGAPGGTRTLCWATWTSPEHWSKTTQWHPEMFTSATRRRCPFPRPPGLAETALERSPPRNPA